MYPVRSVVVMVLTVASAAGESAAQVAGRSSQPAAAQTQTILGPTSIEYFDDLDAIIIRGKPGDVEATQRLLDHIASQAQTIAQLTAKYTAAEARAAELAERARTDKSMRSRQDLAKAVRVSFEYQQRLREKKIAAARLKLAAAERRLQRRNELVDAIVRQRVDALVFAEDLAEPAAGEGQRPASVRNSHDVYDTRRWLGGGDSPSTANPKYDGRTLSEWLEDLNVERKPQRLTEAVRALTALMDGTSATQVTQGVFQLMRRYGAAAIDISVRGQLIGAAQMAIWHAPAEVAVAEMIREIEQGNVRSRDFMVYLLRAPTFNASSGMDGEQLQREFHKAMTARAAELTSLLLRLADDPQAEVSQWAIKFLARFCDAVEVGSAEMESVTPRFVAALPTRDSELALLLAQLFAADRPETPGLAESLANVVKERGADRDALGYLRALGPHAAPAVPELVRVLPRLWNGDSIYKQAFEIVEILSAIGPAAKEALPVLRDVYRETDGKLERLAAQAIASISGLDPRKPARAAAEIRVLEQLLDDHRIGVGTYPSTQQGLSALQADRMAPEGQGPLLDPWGKAYQYELIAPRRFRLWSLGPDGIDGTGDEVSSKR